MLSRRRSGLLGSSDLLPVMAQNGGKATSPSNNTINSRNWDLRLRLEGALCTLLCLAVAGALWSFLSISYGPDAVSVGIRTSAGEAYKAVKHDVLDRTSKVSKSGVGLEGEFDSRQTQSPDDTWFEDVQIISGRVGPKAIVRPSDATALDPKTNVSLIGAFLDKGVLFPSSHVSRIIVNAAVQIQQQTQNSWECLLCRTGPLQPDGRWGPDFSWTGVAPPHTSGMIATPRRLQQNEEPELDEDDEDTPAQNQPQGGGDSALNCWKSKGVEVHVDWGDLPGEPSLAMQWHCLMAEGDDGFDSQWAAVVRPSNKWGVEKVLFPGGEKSLRRFTAVDQSSGRVVTRGARKGRTLLNVDGNTEELPGLRGGSTVHVNGGKDDLAGGRHLLVENPPAKNENVRALERGEERKTGRGLLQLGETVPTRWARKLAREGNTAVANVTVCTGPLYGDQHEMLAEWVAFNLLMGANKLRIYYLAKQVSPKLIPVLEYYARGGRLEYYEWHPPQVDAFYNGQNVFYHDCYYRSAADSDYVLFTDVDEFLAPSHVTYDTWHEALDPYFKTPRMGALHFQNWFYHLQCPVQGPSIRSGLVTSSVPGRRTEPIPKTERTKFMVQSGAATWLGVHFLEENSALQPGFVRKDVSAGLAHVRHYTYRMNTGDCSPGTIKKHKKDRGMDYSMLRFQERLYARVQAALSFVERYLEADQRT